MRKQALGLVGLAAGMLLAAAPAASAATLTVCASGCTYATVSAAIAASSPDDVIDVMPGTYTERVTVDRRLTVQGHPGGARPVITDPSASMTMFSVTAAGAGTTLRHLDLRATGASATALSTAAGTTASDLALTATGQCANIGGSPTTFGPDVTATQTDAAATSPCILAGGPSVTLSGLTVSSAGATTSASGVSIGFGATLTDSTVNAANMALAAAGGTIRRTTLNGRADGISSTGIAIGTTLVTDSVVTSTAAGGSAILAPPQITFGTGTLITLRNVTAIASGSMSKGLEAGAFSFLAGLGGGPGVIDARNVIARGTLNDVAADPADNPCTGGFTCSPGMMTIGYSNFRSTSGVVDTTTVGHNQHPGGDPMFVNGTPGPSQDFHLASPSSPVIGAGIADPPNTGPTDRDGVVHPSTPSIGAYEYVPPPPPTTGGGTGGGATGTAPPGTAAPGTAAASNAITITSATSGKDGTIYLSVRTPAGGTIAATGTTGKGGKATAARRRKKTRIRAITYGRTAARVPGAGITKLAIKPFRAARRILRNGKKLNVSVNVTFTPTTGQASRQSIGVAVRLAKRKHKKR